MEGIKLGNKQSKYPIIQGGMGVGVSLHKLAGTVSKEGGIGVISAADIGYQEEDFNKNQIELTNKKDGNAHKYDASIRTEITPEQIERNKIQNKLLVGENVTPEELEILNDYYSSEQFRNSYKKLKEVAQEGLATIKRLQTAYSKLNDIGQEKVAEHAEMIAKIPEYQKDPDEPQED